MTFPRTLSRKPPLPSALANEPRDHDLRPSRPTLEVRPAQPGDREAWNAFVLGHPDGTFFHLVEWRDVIRKALRHATFYRVAVAHGEIRGVLPLARIRSRLFGDSLVSTPFCVYGGILAADEDARAILTSDACRLARDLGVDYLEMRNRQRSHPDWPCKDLYVTFRKNIEADPEANLKAIPRKQRAMVRKGIGERLVSEIDHDIDRFWKIYSESVRNLGTPVFPRRLFSELRRQFGEQCEILTVTHAGHAQSSVLSFYFRDEVLPYYGGGTIAARRTAANDFMYWELMRRAGERGVRVFDYGRSKQQTGSFGFKKHWGFEPEPLFYEYYLVRAQKVPEINPLNPRYRLFIDVWKRLPLWVSRRIGPLIARNLG